MTLGYVATDVLRSRIRLLRSREFRRQQPGLWGMGFASPRLLEPLECVGVWTLFIEPGCPWESGHAIWSGNVCCHRILQASVIR